VKKYIMILMAVISLNVNAEMESKTIGRISTFTGTTVSLSVISRYNEKSVFMYVRGKYGVRKVSAVMKKGEVIRLRDLLNKAIEEMK